MDIADRVAQARLQQALAAAQRWETRRGARQQQAGALATGGRGAADSPARQLQFGQREAARSMLMASGKSGFVGLAERQIGPTLDMSEFAPSDVARQAGRPVARLVTGGRDQLQPQGFATGFLVSPRLLLTNYHVFATAADCRDIGANFEYESSDRGISEGSIFDLDAETFFWSNAALDCALVAVKDRAREGTRVLADFGYILLIEATPKILLGQPINIVQHPAGGPKRYAVSQNVLLDLLDTGFLTYTTDTLPGSSGSPAFSAQWEVVGLHHSGVPRTRDGAILTKAGQVFDPDRDADDDIDWIANEGIRVSAIVKALAAATLPTAQAQALLRELLRSTVDPLAASKEVIAQAKAGVASAPTSPAAAMSGFHTFVFHGPTTLHIYAPSLPAGPGPAAVPAAIAPPLLPVPAMVEKKQNFDPDYDHRPGYDPKFLGVTLPVPTVVAERGSELYTDAAGAPQQLDYHHFSIVFNQDRRLLMWAASNADYSPNRRDADKAREDYGSENWSPDPRIEPESLQLQDADFYKPATRIDRGHIVRRDDNCWGTSPRLREYANADSYHWTNCTPQHELFNQEHPKKAEYRGLKGMWGMFERYLVDQLGMSATPRATLFAGPVLDNDHDPAADFGAGPIQYPRRYWKVVCLMAPAQTLAPDASLAVYAFLFDQGPILNRFGIEALTLANFAAEQTTLAHVEEVTGVRFAPILHAHDVFDKAQAGPTKPLSNAQEIFLGRPNA